MSFLKAAVNVSRLYQTIYFIVIIATVTLTIDRLYVSYYGFELLNAFLHVANFVVALLLIYVSLNRFLSFWFLIYSLYVLLVTLVFYSNVLFANVMHLSLVFLFIFALPHLNKDIAININIQRFLLKVIGVVTLVFLVNNIDVYLNGLFADKSQYERTLSSINVIGYFQYLGFSISWMLLDYTRKKRYIFATFFYFMSSIFLLPVLTVYVVILTYVFIMFFLRKRKISRCLIAGVTFFLLMAVVVILIERFDDWKIYLSSRDVLYANSIELIKDNVWFGYGVNNWGYIFMEMKNPHNFILYLLLSFGLFGFVFYSVHIYILLSASFRKLKGFKGVSCYEHMHAQIFSHLLMMSAFVSMPGHYQGISIFLSIYYSLVINFVLHVRAPRKNLII